jgi:hypothetical protein
VELPHVNYLAVLVCGVIIFMLGGLWYSPLLFAKKWMALMGFTEDHITKAMANTSMAAQYASVFFCGMITSLVMAVIVNQWPDPSALHGALVGALCWLGFAGATSYGTSLFSMKPKQLWLINSGYNLVCFVIAGAILGAWR